MKPKQFVSLMIGLFFLGLLTGCIRNRLSSPGIQPAANATNPPATILAAPLSTATSGVTEGVTPVQEPSLATAPVQSLPAATATAVQPTPTTPAADSQDDSKAADNLSKMLDDLNKDLNSADNLNNDVK